MIVVGNCPLDIGYFAISACERQSMESRMVQNQSKETESKIEPTPTLCMGKDQSLKNLLQGVPPRPIPTHPVTRLTHSAEPTLGSSLSLLRRAR